ncbi:MAG: hypothetical protein JWR53_462 [Glaciihabitans sp.]|nr:hypothetical protein [Glaciihabitans sp.]
MIDRTTVTRPVAWPAASVPWRIRYRLTPWWVRVLVIFLASRVITTSFLLAFAAMQQQNFWTGPHPDYFSFASLWDGHWFYIVGVSGYPSQLPLTPDGHIAQNAWAFMPAYPITVAALSSSVVPFAIMAVVVSVLFAAGSALMFYRLMARVLPSGTALFSTVLFCVAPVTPIMQVAYAESMQMFFLLWAMNLVAERRYLRLLPVVLVLSLTRPTGLAFALFLVLHVAHRWWTRNRDSFPRDERWASVLAIVFTGVAGLAWPAIAWAVTGRLTAYTDTELSWRSDYIGHVELLPFQPWLQGAQWWLNFNHWPAPALWGAIVLVLVVAGFFAFLFTPPARRLGFDLRAWSASWAIYLLAVFFPQSSTFRLLLPMFPLLGTVAQPKSTLYRVTMVLVFLALQWGWLYIAWWSDGYDWTPP